MRGLSLTIQSGQFVSVIGSNGAKQAIFLNAVAGDLSVDRGSIQVDGIDVTRKQAWQRTNRVARVFQDPMAGTCEAWMIEENMALAMARGLGFAIRGNMRELFREKLAILNLGLRKRLSDHIGLFSGGQRQAVSLLMASLRPSRILLLE